MEYKMICKKCGNEIPDGKIFCKECGKKNTDIKISIAIIAVGIIASLLIFILEKSDKNQTQEQYSTTPSVQSSTSTASSSNSNSSNTDSSNSTSSNTEYNSNNTNDISSNYTDTISLYFGGEDILVGITKDALSEAINCISNKDEYGFRELVLSGQIYTVPSKTKAKVIDRSWTMNKVRILEGKHTGEAGWVIMESTK
ncbi:MAG: hypothetical protein ACYC0N_00505 [Carboxydocellales bacterium]